MATRHMDTAILLVLKTTTILVLQTTTIPVPKSTISLVANTTRALIEAMEMETTVPWLFVRDSFDRIWIYRDLLGWKGHWQIVDLCLCYTCRFGHTPWKINMEPTNHPFRKENDLPNLHDYGPC